MSIVCSAVTIQLWPKLAMDTAFYHAVFGLTPYKGPIVHRSTAEPVNVKLSSAAPSTLTTLVALFVAATAKYERVSTPAVTAKYEQVSAVGTTKNVPLPSVPVTTAVVPKRSDVLPVDVFSTRKIQTATTARLKRLPTVKMTGRTTTWTTQKRIVTDDPYLVTPQEYRKYASIAVPRRTYTWPKIETPSKTKFTQRPVVTTVGTKRPLATRYSTGQLESRLTTHPFYVYYYPDLKEKVGKSRVNMTEKRVERMPYNIPEPKYGTTAQNYSIVTRVYEKLTSEVEPSVLTSLDIDYGIITLICIGMAVTCTGPVYIILLQVYRKMSRLKRRRSYQPVDTNVDLIMRMEQVEYQVSKCRREMKTSQETKITTERNKFEEIEMVSLGGVKIYHIYKIIFKIFLF